MAEKYSEMREKKNKKSEKKIILSLVNNEGCLKYLTRLARE